MDNRINKIVTLAIEYIKQGCEESEAVKKAEKEVREKENNKYGICC